MAEKAIVATVNVIYLMAHVVNFYFIKGFQVLLVSEVGLKTSDATRHIDRRYFLTISRTSFLNLSFDRVCFSMV